MKKTLTLIASIILFIELFDTTFLYSCLVPVAHDLHTESAGLTLSLLAYIVGTCVFIPMVSWLSSKYNKVNIIVFTLIAFAFTSMLCSVSYTVYDFSLYRFLQGIFISICSATMIILLLSNCAAKDIVKTMGIVNIPALLGTAIGPFCGAVFSFYFSWRFVFIINLPICILIVTTLMRMKSLAMNSRVDSSAVPNFDYLGLILISTSLILFSIGINQFTSNLNYKYFIVAMIGAAMLVSYIALWKMRQSRQKKSYSILNLSVFSNSNFNLGTIINVISRSAMCGFPILLSIVLQQVYQFSMIHTGLYLAIIALAGIVAKCFSPWIEKIGIYKVIIFSSLLIGISIMLFSSLNYWLSNGYFFMVCILFGFFMSLLYTAMNSMMYLKIEKEQISNVSNIFAIIQQFSIGLGVMCAVGGFQLLFSTHQISMATAPYFEILNYYKIICVFLTILMSSNLIIIMFHKIYLNRIFHRSRIINA